MPQPKFPEIEQEILKFWEENKIFEQSINKPAPRGDFVFYDGPPFATGLPHYGHILVSTIKDVIPRYKTMRGYRVRRRWGWDCHGLPIENIVEKQLGISGKKQIEERGIKEFNEACRAGVLKYAAEWGKMVRRIARWVDFDNSYKTMDVSYMDSVWWALKKFWDKKLIYEGRKVLLYCPRCETPISNFEVAMDNSYQEVAEEAVTVKFKVHNPSHPPLTLGGGEVGDVYLLAWTTTPWTLPGNVALAVGEEIDYVVVKIHNPPQPSLTLREGDADSSPLRIRGGRGVTNDAELLILAKARLSTLGEGYEIVQEMKGKDLVGLKYEPLFDIPAVKNKQAFKVYPANFVNTEDGTGIVHTAVVYGEEDYELGLKHKLPIVPLLDEKGIFNEKAPELIRGKYFKDSETIIKDDLEKRGLLFKREVSTHSYPFCWRCETALFYNAIPAWFIKIQKIKKKLIKQNEKINWYPEHLKHGRFKNGLENAPDWNISRNRYWATPLPFWKAEDGEVICVGSKQELEELSGKKIDDLHKHIIDDVVIERNGKTFHRIPEVLDCWFESASMPFAEFHYPVENKELFENRYPADFVTEYISQTRAWFYVMHVVGVFLFGKPSFKNVVATGIILAEDGSKMSKSKNNFPDPWDVIGKYGADALRYYLMTSVVMQADNLNFSEREVDEAYKKIVLLTLNVLSFYKLYSHNSPQPSLNLREGAIEDSPLKLRGDRGVMIPTSRHILDRWIIARLHEMIRDMTTAMDKYDVVSAGRLIPEFVNDLSTWYLRRSRDRFKSGKKRERDAALRTTNYVLQTLSQVMAPFMPFLAEHIYQEIIPPLRVRGGEEGLRINHNPPQPSLTLREGDEVLSVHLGEWPKFKKRLIDAELLEQMATARKIVEMAHSARAEAKIRVRQPLLELRIRNQESGIMEELLKLVADEVNVKQVVIASEPQASAAISEIATASGLAMTDLWITKTDGALTVSLNTIITPELQKEGLLRELTRQVNDLRKKAGLTPADVVNIIVVSPNQAVQSVIKDYQKALKKAVLARSIRPAPAPKQVEFAQEIEMEDYGKLWIGISRMRH